MTVTCDWADFLPGLVFQSSPNLANLDSSGPSVVVGTRDSGQVVAVHLADGSQVAGFPVDMGYSVDSSPTAIPSQNPSLDNLAVSAGDVTTGSLATDNGAVAEIGPTGNVIWERSAPDQYGTYGSTPAVVASPAVADTTGSGSPSLVIGGVSLSQYSLQATDGSTEVGWPQKTADTTFSTAAIADLYGANQPVIVAGSDSSAGPGALYDWNGGVVRAESGTGQTLWSYRTDEVVTSSPAVGSLAGNGNQIVFGHGRYWADREPSADATTVTALNASGSLDWQTDLGGYTTASPALADLQGTGQLDVVEPTWIAAGQSDGGGTVAALGPTGNKIWTANQFPVVGSNSNLADIYGGVATADFGEGYQDVVAATSLGWNIFDGTTGAPLLPAPQAPVTSGGNPTTEASSNIDGENVLWNGTEANLDMENTPLVTNDPSGGLDVVLAGTYAGVPGTTPQGFIAKYHVTTSGTPRNASIGAGSWPMFHHDPQHTGSAIQPALSCSGCQGPPADPGYILAAADGGIFAYGNAQFHGSMGGKHLNQPVVGVAETPDSGGYWEVASDGGIFAFGDAAFYGSMGGRPLNRPIVGIASTPDGHGYWEVASDGGIFAFGDAAFYGSTGSINLNKPVVAMTSSPDGHGYWMVASDGGIFAFGDASFHGSMGGHPLSQPVVGMALSPGGGGYWLVASDGGIFAFDAPFYGSMGGHPLNRPVVGISVPPPTSGGGYWETASDGGIFAFGGAPFEGSAGSLSLSAPIVASATTQ